MTVKYSVFDVDVVRLIAVYDTQEQAIAFASALLNANSDDYADELVVDGETENGEIFDSLTGDALRDQVHAFRTRHERVGASATGA